jgi:hypothetical protein
MEKIFKRFDLQKAIAGEPICDTVGNRVKFLAYEPAAPAPVICLRKRYNGTVVIETYTSAGIFDEKQGVSINDLRMAEDVNECLCRLLRDEDFLVDGRAGRVEEQARAICAVLDI